MAKNTKLFKDIEVSNNVSRNGFDLSHSTKFTAKAGELLVIHHNTVTWGDKFKLQVKGFTRTRPVQTAAFTKINEYYDWFFVPYRLLGKQIPNILAQNKDNPTIATSSTSNQSIGTKLPNLPFIQLAGTRGTGNKRVFESLGTKKNNFGFYRAHATAKLLNHLGYCWLDRAYVDDISGISPKDTSLFQYALNPEVSMLPLAAYQKIYYDYFRNSQWEDNQPYNYNFDYLGSTGLYVIPDSTNINFWNNPTIFDLRYANYPKDLFFGLLPNSQYGDTVTVDVDIVNSLNDVSSSLLRGDVKESASNRSLSLTVDTPGGYVQSTNAFEGSLYSDNRGAFTTALDSLSGTYSILEQRRARFMQKYAEVMGTGKKDFKSIVSRIFNVDVSDTLSDVCTYLGGNSNVISISEVENTNLNQSDNSVGEGKALVRGKGVGSVETEFIDFEAQEPGILMCIYHAVPQVDFALNSFHFDVTKTEVDDFANPVFDKLGLQEFPVYYLDNSLANNITSSNVSFGYTTRYFDYKTSLDMVLGDFRESLKDWVAPVDQVSIRKSMQNSNGLIPTNLTLSANFFKVNPSILDRIFAMTVDSYLDTDQFLVDAYVTVQAVRPLDYKGMPYDY